VPRSAATWQVRERDGGEWSPLYAFMEDPQHASDVLMANHFTATHPSSPFVGHLVVARKDASPAAACSTAGSVTRPGGASEERTLTDAEFAAALRDDLRLELGAGEVDGLIGSSPPYVRNQ